MKKRSVASVIILTIVTFGFYGLVWSVKTKNEMNKLGASIPTAWLLIVPVANIYWLWKYSEGVEIVTKEKLSTIMTFVLFWLVGIVGMAIVQSEFNKTIEVAPAGNTGPAKPAAVAQPSPTSAEATPNPDVNQTTQTAKPVTTTADVTPPAVPVAPAAPTATSAEPKNDNPANS